MAYRNPLAFLLGFEGLALHRAYAGEFGPTFVDERLAEVRAMLADPALCAHGEPIGEIGTVDGYRYWAETYDDPGNPLIDLEELIVRELITGLAPGRALDAACGTGRLSRLMAENGHAVVGVDSSPDMLARATTPAVRGELGRLPVGDASFGLVTCGLALMHQPDLAPVFAEFARVLRPGGRLVTSDIHWQSLYLGGIASVIDDDGVEARLPAFRHRPGDYVTAAVAAGLDIEAYREPLWPPSAYAGGELLRSWAAGAVDAAYQNTPAAAIWRFKKR